MSSDAQGNFVVVWDIGQYLRSIIGRRFEASGQAIGGEFRVNEPPPSDFAAWRSEVAMRDDRSFVVVWQNQCWNCCLGFEEAYVIGRRFDAQGNPSGSEFQVNAFATGVYQGQSAPAIRHRRWPGERCRDPRSRARSLLDPGPRSCQLRDQQRGRSAAGGRRASGRRKPR